MSKSEIIELPIPPRVPLNQLSECLEAQLPRAGVLDLKCSFYDTFDWRLFRAGLCLTGYTGSEAPRLVLRRLADGKVLAWDVEVPAPPYFVWDLADRGLRKLLEPVAEMRSLNDQVSVLATGSLHVSDDGGTRLSLLYCRLVSPSNMPGQPLGDWLLLERPMEADGPSAELIAPLSRRFAIDTAAEPLILHALTAEGRRPENPTPSPILALDPAQRADSATRAILLRLLQAMEVNEAGLLDGRDTEFLHDFRVAVRRTRSALGQIKAVLPPRTVARFVPAFAWLGQITSPPRDLDVYLLGFEDLRAQVPPDLQPALEPLKEVIKEKRVAAHRALARQLGSGRYKRLKLSWRKVLQASPARPRAANARRPIAEVADERILKVFRRVLKQGKAITDDSPDEQLHELRKSCKKLRYLLEFFQSLYPSDRIKALIKHLKGFQNHLGELQDLSAQIHTLYALGQELRSRRATEAETLLAMGALLGHLDRRRRALRESFERSFKDFSGAESHAHYRRLFCSQRTRLQIPGESRE
jgi:CHAD domain-containing protein